MASYWIVVPRGNEELFQLLSLAFRGRSDFSVIVDRRLAADAVAGSDRRGAESTPGPDEIIVAERADRVERPVESAGRRARMRPAASRRRSLGRSAHGAGAAHGVPPLPAVAR
jgi:hypothetical protein